MTQADLAQRSGLHVTYISGIERGRRNPTWTVILALCEALNTTAAELAARADR
jgi:transcriptional regulator with XRE-family HTH domain